MGAGAHTVEVGRIAGDGNAFYVDCCITPAVDPPMVIVCKEPPTVSTSMRGDSRTWAQHYSDYAATVNGLIDSVVAEFPNAHTVDLASSAWTLSTAASMVSTYDTSSNLHPSDRGMSAITDIIEGDIRGRVTGYSAGLHTL
jgi:hypothetical protein